MCRARFGCLTALLTKNVTSDGVALAGYSIWKRVDPYMPNTTQKPGKIEMACNCGKLRGHGLNISSKTGRHVVCMCDDCQAFAHFLGQPQDILDCNGGSEIFQISPSQIRLVEGLDHLACMRLSPKGPLRWYASCCNTPVANTAPSPALPFAGVFCAFIKPRAASGRDAVLGPVKMRFFGSHGYGNIPPGTQKKFSAATIIRTIFWLIGHKIRGNGKPTPFFTDHKSPVSEPIVLTKQERAQLAIPTAAPSAG